MDPYEEVNSSLPNDRDLGGEEEPEWEFAERMDNLESELEPPPLDFYGVLGVSRTSSEEEIKDAYRRLCRVFHPDRHVDEEKRKMAESKFHVIHKAYEVLTNPGKRTIYDAYGEEGLQTSWELGPRLKTPAEMREEFEKQARLKREAEIENLVRSKAKFQLGVDASQVFNTYQAPVPGFATAGRKQAQVGILGRLSRVEIQQLSMKHSFESPLGSQTHGIVGGSMVARNGIGGGNLSGAVRHTFSPRLWVEAGASIMKPRVMHLKGFYSIDSDTFLNAQAQGYSLYAPPILGITAGRRIGEGVTGFLTYKTGVWSLGPWGAGYSNMFRGEKSAVSVGVSGVTKSGRNYTIELQTGIAQSYISADYNWKLPDSVRLRVNGALTTVGGIQFSVGGDRRVTKHARIAMAVEMGLATGVCLKFMVTRLGQSLVLPIMLSGDLDLKLAFWAAVLPSCAYLAVDRAVLKPRRRKKAQERLEMLRAHHAEAIAHRRREAEEATRLLLDMVTRKVEQEERRNGLVIVEAVYGNLDSPKDQMNTDGANPTVINVTVPVQALVNNSQLIIPGGYSKSNILGFYDPCMGEKKHLRIRYRFQHKLHEITIEDRQSVACPLRSHIVDN
ncbi:uncharacterized protein VTP21DRAFT_9376 [Calcarisporiella thermophila]|uniref:uncharacterized protein n=1 Tax=Calcarisporiella thermophila TaxID=911321 RepID=UPI0037430436